MGSGPGLEPLITVGGVLTGMVEVRGVTTNLTVFVGKVVFTSSKQPCYFRNY